MSWNPKIPIRYKEARYEDVPENIREKFTSIIKTRRGIYIFGDVGTGKTHIAYSLHSSQYPVAYCSRFWNTTELLHEIRADFARDINDKRRTEEELMSLNRLLFLDDVGAEKITDWVMETFYLIINKRYNDMLPIIFTSNYSIKELVERIGDRIASRIVETCDIIELKGVDRRLKR